MDPIPTAHDLYVTNLYVVAHLKEHRVVRRVHNRHIAKSETPAIDEGDGMRAAHLFLAGRIEDFVAIDHSASSDGNLLDVLADNQCTVPFAPFGLGHDLRRLRLRIPGKIRCADEPCAVFQVECNAASKVNRAREITTGREKHLPAAVLGAGIDRFLNRRRVEDVPVPFSAARADIDLAHGHSGKTPAQ